MGNIVHFNRRRGNNQEDLPPPDNNWLLDKHDGLRYRSRIKRYAGALALTLGLITAAVSGPEVATAIQPNMVIPPVPELTLSADVFLIGFGILGVASGIIDSSRADGLETELMRRGVYPIAREIEPFVEL